MEHIDDDPQWDAALDVAAWDALLSEPRSLLDSDPTSLSRDGAFDLLDEIQRERARLDTKEALALLRVAGHFAQEREVTVLDRCTDAERTIVLRDESLEEISAALHRSMNVVHDQICTARLLDSALPLTAEALVHGRITAEHARMIADQARRLTGSDLQLFRDPARDTAEQASRRAGFLVACQALEGLVFRAAADLTPGQTRSLARRAVIAIDPAGHERRRQEARHGIGVDIVPEDDGLAVLLARLPIEEAARIKAALDARAHVGDEDGADADGRTVGERRVAALVDAVLGDGSAAQGAATQVSAEIQVVIPLDALLGDSDAPATLSLGAQQPEPVAAQAVRRLLADPHCPVTLRRLVTDPLTGHLLDRGRHAYRVTDAMRAFITTRDQTCRFPGCTRSAKVCQIDHAMSWDDGGKTERTNLGPLCVRHHQLKTHGGWDLLATLDDGTVEWRSPGGRMHSARPPSLARSG